MSSGDPEEIRGRVVVLGADADEWARPELEAFHLPSEHEAAAGALAEETPNANNAQGPPPAAAAPPPNPVVAPLETELPPNAMPSSSSSNSNSNSNEQQNKEKKGVALAPAPLGSLFRFADGLDCVLMSVGSVGALVHGCSLPVFLRFFADLVDSFGSHADDPDTMVRLVVKSIHGRKWTDTHETWLVYSVAMLLNLTH
ncbi:hypothetical protein EJB05_47594, partial [Eragrostis curvula]